MTEEDKFYEAGFSTNLKPKSKSAMKGSDQVEHFLTQVERELLSIECNTKISEKKEKYQ